MRRQRVKSPGERRREGVVPGDQDAHDLIADLPVAQPGAVVLTGEDEEREKVRALGLRTPSSKVVVDKLVEPLDAISCAPVSARRHPLWQERTERAWPPVREDVVERASDLPARGGPEDCPRHRVDGEEL